MDVSPRRFPVLCPLETPRAAPSRVRPMKTPSRLTRAMAVACAVPKPGSTVAVCAGCMGGLSIQKPYSVPRQRMTSSHFVGRGMPVLGTRSRSCPPLTMVVGCRRNQ